MFLNSLRITLRVLLKERFYAFINIIGLAIGVATTLLIAVFINHEISFDKEHPDLNKLYRVNQTAIWSPNTEVMGSSVIPLAAALEEEIPGIESTLRINTPGSQQVNIEKNGKTLAFNESNVLGTDPNFFEYFSFELDEGDPTTALLEPNSVVLSTETAIKYFGTTKAVGETILLGEQKTPVVVTGVTKPHPSNIHFDFDLLLSIHTNRNIKRFEWSWIWTQVVTYAKFDGDPRGAQPLLDGIAHKYAANAFERLGIDMGEFEKENGSISFYLQPVADIHLGSRDIPNRLAADSDVMYIYIFATIAVFVLILACINFMNLTTARASNRAKEIGIKKVLGSSRKLLIYQFLMEAIVMSVIATILGIGLMELMRTGMLVYLDFELQSFFLFLNPTTLAFIIVLPILVGIIAGSYPALYMTSFQPNQVLKGTLSKGVKNGGVRSVLVVFQFTVAIALIACTTIVYQQVQYFQNGEMGFGRENILKINDAHKLGDQLESFKEELVNYNGVKQLSVASLTPGRFSMEDFFALESTPDEKVSMATVKVDEHYLSTLKMKLVAGRNFANDRPSDKSAIVLNEAAVEAFGLTTQTAVGQTVQYYENQKYEVIGVVKNYYSSTLRNGLYPIGLFHLDSEMFYDNRVIAVSFDPNNLNELLAYSESGWKSRNDSAPFNYSFLDEDLEQIYATEAKLGGLFTVFTTLAMLIACIGLFGLASYITLNRSKEIGIRKVLGASTQGLIFMLNSNFSKLIAVSVFIAVPISWFAMDNWLQQFTNKISIGWEAFALAGASAFVLAWMIVGFQSLKASLLNPVETLRDE